MRVTGAQLAMLIEGLSEWSRKVLKVIEAAEERLLNRPCSAGDPEYFSCNFPTWRSRPEDLPSDPAALVEDGKPA